MTKPDALLSPSRDAVNEHLLESLLQSVNEIVWCTSADGSELLFVNRAIEKIYGRPLEKLVEHKNFWLDAIHPDDRERFEQ